MNRSLTIAIPSYRRPESLSLALEGVARAIRALDSSTRVDVLVIDNDPAGSASEVAVASGARYLIEPVAGLAAVRNRALDEAAASDLLVFLDDDEEPEPEWLVELLAMLDRTGADGVAGKVITTLPPQIDGWFEAVGAFERFRRVDGQLMPQAATNNLLLRMDAVRESGVRFDSRFGLTGGEDNLFTSQFSRAGKVILWAERALVRENIIPERVDRRWVLMRSYRTGNSTARIRLVLAQGTAARLLSRTSSFFGGLLRVAQGIAIWIRGALSRSLRWRARGVRHMYRGAGFVAGAVGWSYREYARPR